MDDRRRFAGVLTVAAVAVLDVVLIFLLFRGDDDTSARAPEEAADVRATTSPSGSAEASPTRSPTASPTGSPSASPDDSEAEQPAATISLSLPTRPAETATPLPLRGRYADAEPGTRLVLERRRAGEWVAFPLPTATRADGRFRTFVALTKPGSYRLRVRDPDAGVTSKVAVLRVR